MSIALTGAAPEIVQVRPDAPPTERWRPRPALVAALLIVLGTAYRLYLILNLMPPTNSDESTIGIAALHIAQGRDFPIFFYGQHHMGTLEAYLAAPLVGAFGPSVVALRLPMLALYVVFACLMYRLTARLYSAWFAVFVVGLLAIGSHPVVRGELFAGGGYPEIKPIGAGLLVIALWLAGKPARGRLLGFAAWGLLAGLAVWTDWLIMPYVAAAAGVLVLTCSRELLGRSGLALLAGSVIGALPTIVYNVQSVYADTTLAEMLYLSRNVNASLGDRIYGGVFYGVPLATGLCDGGYCEGWPLALGAAYPLLLLLAGTLAVVGLRGPEHVRHAGRLALVVGGALTLILYTRSDGAGLSPGTNVRYLTPLLLTLPAVLWPMWAALSRLRRPRAWPLAVAGATGLAVFVFAMGRATVEFASTVDMAHTMARDERALAAELERLGLTRIYSEYWTCARVAFATEERVVCAALADDLSPGHDRYLPYRTEVAEAPNPAYVLPIGSTVEQAFAAELRAEGVPAEVREVAGYRIYRPEVALSIPSMHTR
jgi:hypothetical protein